MDRQQIGLNLAIDGLGLEFKIGNRSRENRIFATASEAKQSLLLNYEIATAYFVGLAMTNRCS